MSEIEIPKLLYKYRKFDPNTMKLLEDGQIYFATIEDLSDDFEYSFIWHREEWVNLSEKECEYFNKPSNGSNNNNVLLTKNEYTERIFNYIKKNQSYGILSLTEFNNNPYMWDRYADGLKGICIGFDWNRFNLMFSGSPPQEKNIPKKVSYVSSPIVISGMSKEWFEVFHTKWEAYSYEKEWRMFYEKGCYESKDIRCAIREVIFGNNVKQEVIENVKKSLKDLKDISFLTIERKFDQYKYKVVPYEFI